jgi:hypothetical protein
LGRPSKIVFLSISGMPLALLGLLWAISFVDVFIPQDCSFGSVTASEYQKILSAARAQRWTVWPGLSNGVFFPSDRGIGVPTSSFDDAVNNQLLDHARELAGPGQSADRQLAAAHAVMHSIGAEYVRVSEIPDTHRTSVSNVHFTYFLPTIRFAPGCLICLAWWYTTIDIIVSHDIGAHQYQLNATNVLSAQLKYNPDKERARNLPKGECPVFPGSVRPRG